MFSLELDKTSTHLAFFFSQVINRQLYTKCFLTSKHTWTSFNTFCNSLFFCKITVCHLKKALLQNSCSFSSSPHESILILSLLCVFDLTSVAVTSVSGYFLATYQYSFTATFSDFQRLQDSLYFTGHLHVWHISLELVTHSSGTCDDDDDDDDTDNDGDGEWWWWTVMTMSVNGIWIEHTNVLSDRSEHKMVEARVQSGRTVSVGGHAVWNQQLLHSHLPLLVRHPVASQILSRHHPKHLLWRKSVRVEIIKQVN